MTPSGMGTTGKAWSNNTKDHASEGTRALDRATTCAHRQAAEGPGPSAISAIC